MSYPKRSEYINSEHSPLCIKLLSRVLHSVSKLKLLDFGTNFVMGTPLLDYIE